MNFCRFWRCIHYSGHYSGKWYTEHASHQFIKIVKRRDDQGVGGDCAHHNRGRDDYILRHPLTVFTTVYTPYKFDHLHLTIPPIIPHLYSSPFRFDNISIANVFLYYDNGLDNCRVNTSVVFTDSTIYEFRARLV
jgi:hypothetical protein